MKKLVLVPGETRIFEIRQFDCFGSRGFPVSSAAIITISHCKFIMYTISLKCITILFNSLTLS